VGLVKLGRLLRGPRSATSSSWKGCCSCAGQADGFRALPRHDDTPLQASKLDELITRAEQQANTHGPDGAVVEANQAFADMLGYTLTEALALTAAQVIHPRG